MAVARALVFDRYGSMLAEIEPELEFVNWRLNNEGQCRFSMAWSDPKCTRENLQLGNRLLVQFDNGLPDWGGVLDLPRKRVVGKITATAYTGEHLLDWRVTGKNTVFSNTLPGAIFSSLLSQEDEEHPTGISIGTIWSGGTPRSLEYHYHDLLRRCQDLARLTGHDFAVLPVFAGNELSFEAHFYERRGRDKSDSIWLLGGANVQEPTLDEQGKMANRVILVGEGTTWDDDRLDAITEDASSQAEYDYREYSEVQSGVKVQGTLDANAEALLDEKKQPANRVTIAAVDEKPGRFADYGIGDVVTASLFVDSEEWYFEAPVRVLAREWRPGETCRLEVEEYQG